MYCSQSSLPLQLPTAYGIYKIRSADKRTVWFLPHGRLLCAYCLKTCFSIYLCVCELAISLLSVAAGVVGAKCAKCALGPASRSTSGKCTRDASPSLARGRTFSQSTATARCASSQLLSERVARRRGGNSLRSSVRSCLRALLSFEIVVVRPRACVSQCGVFVVVV